MSSVKKTKYWFVALLAMVALLLAITQPTTPLTISANPECPQSLFDSICIGSAVDGGNGSIISGGGGGGGTAGKPRAFKSLYLG